MNLLIYKTLEELNQDLADYVIKIAEMSIEENDRFNFVLTGGSSPKALYHLLATECEHRIDWEKVYFFFGDERNVPSTDENYNGLMAKKTLLDPLGIKEDHIFYVNTTLAPEKAAIEYKKSIDKHFNGEDPAFDLILLGMGDDAHTASIFPHTTLVKDQEVDVAAVFVEKLNTYRISFTAPLINKADNVAFLVFGENKAEALKHVINDEEKNFDLYPSQLIDPIDGKLTWFTDEAATRLLEE
ncbi:MULTISPECIES: 6-phosphogluconolactonase [unclassified Pedobacter]|uniref:6-phosphogluconolactonase n=1 Tax=unclassified Pedobacter TaxID=2628915 RepID=UPI000B4AA907|nr:MULTISPECIES: 6-phosphogluconolactonase [unclassified Pedobacter]MCX2430244.1 6-phosphogluconolactonase [Pedobacter sp. GR22-10]MCX2585865.1 6-phosphogluconolactonase [Pedobacter sp. MR22-3]OWK70224.1 6-phosphogluconolactonase [Pedobacter sp. AJM]